MRLELSRRTDLAVKALRMLSREGSRVSRSDLAAEIGTSPDFVAKVLAPLVHAAVLDSEPGRGGGYEIAGDLRELSILRLIELTEGLPPQTRCVLRATECDDTSPCALHVAWSDARAAMYRTLDGTPVADHVGD